MFKRLTEAELNDLWNQMDLQGGNVQGAARNRDALKVYAALGELELLHRQLRSHYAAVAKDGG